MKNSSLIIAILLFALQAEAATIYIDGSMGSDCTSGNYSIVNRNCTGSDGNAYNDISAALTASAANDTLYFRSGSITSNIAGEDGTAPKSGQTWASCTPCGDAAKSATIMPHAENRGVIAVTTGNHDVTIRDLTIVGSFRFGILIYGASRVRVINNDISGFNDTADSGNAGVTYWTFSAVTAVDGEITDNYIHDPVQTATDHTGVSLASNAGGSVGNILVARNRIVGTRFGIWLDVAACSPSLGMTPCMIERNYLETVGQACMHSEVGSAATWRNNVCDRPGRMGFLMRPGASGSVNDGTKIQHNTIYNPGRSGEFGMGIWIQNDQATASVTNLLVENNIIYRDGGSDNHLIMVGELTVGETTNRYRNNLLHAVGSTNGVCWGSAASQTGAGCAGTPGTTFDDTSSGMTAWAAAAPANVVSGNVTGDPKFVGPLQ